MMLRAIPTSWFSRNYYIIEGTRQVTELDMSWWREQGQLTVEGVLYKIYREKLLSGAFILEKAGSIVARAEKQSAFLRRFFIEYENKQFTLQAKSVFGREFTILEHQNKIGSVAPEGFFTRRAAADLPEELPLPVRILHHGAGVHFMESGIRE